MNQFFIVTAALAVLTLTGCSQNPVNAQKVLKPLVNYQCHQELQDSKLWKATTLLVGESKRQTWENQACECVSENALKDIPAQQLAHALVNEDAKNKLIRQAVLNSVKGCVLNVKSAS